MKNLEIPIEDKIKLFTIELVSLEAKLDSKMWNITNIGFYNGKDKDPIELMYDETI